MGTIVAFGRDRVRRITGLSNAQLRYWDKTGFFSPKYAQEGGQGPYRYAYSYRDVVGLRAIGDMRRKGISLQELRRVGEYLWQHYDEPWSTLSFYIANGKVYFDDPETRALLAGHPGGQVTIRIEMQKIAHEVDEEVNRLRQRNREQIGKISRNRHIAHNAPVLEGTRIPTAAVWDFHEAGYSHESILREYPTLALADIDAAIEYEQARRAPRKQAG